MNGPRYEGDNTWNQVGTAGPPGNLAGRALFQTSVPLAGSSIPLVGYGSALGEEEPALDTMISEGPSILMGEQVLSVEGEGDDYRTEFDPQTGQEILVRLDPDTGEPRSDGDASPGEIEEEPESDPEMARFSDVETMVLNHTSSDVLTCFLQFATLFAFYIEQNVFYLCFIHFCILQIMNMDLDPGVDDEFSALEGKCICHNDLCPLWWSV